MQVAGVSSAGLMITLQPAANARPACAPAGWRKFHGVKAATGPTGTRCTLWLRIVAGAAAHRGWRGA
jgi:hypothetical protein